VVCDPRRSALIAKDGDKDDLIRMRNCRRFGVGHYPGKMVITMVNWPIGLKPINPRNVLPRSVMDTQNRYGVFRKEGPQVLKASVAASTPSGTASSPPTVRSTCP